MGTTPSYTRSEFGPKFLCAHFPHLQNGINNNPKWWCARQPVIVCNESLMLEKLPRCGKSFEEMMKKVDSKKWCNLTEFIKYYDNFSLCTEREASAAKCFWPNRLAQGFITGIHKQFFSNCTSEKDHWEDPPDEILITLIFIPVLLMAAMISIVVWCSKRSDILV
uniref:Receptor activity-modifying protein 3 n=1 Tax=Chelydra serpentina TaxID=8475 RepID=A0A8C3XR91_CHESE